MNAIELYSLKLMFWFFMCYAWIHFIFIQHNKDYKTRTSYEKFITIISIVTFALIVIWL